jgi:hypothetical protein
MRTDLLIERLSGNVAPTPKRAMLRVLALGIGAGAAVSFVLMATTLGIRHDLLHAFMTSRDYWVKFLYTFGFAAAGLWSVVRLSRPGGRANWAVELLPPALIAVVASATWMAAPPFAHHKLLMGGSHLVCPWLIVALSLPIFAGTLWAMRKMAPTQPTLAGAAAGLFAGAAGAWIYGVHCNEYSAVFVAVWYTLGIALVGVLGALIGRRLLRW